MTFRGAALLYAALVAPTGLIRSAPVPVRAPERAAHNMHLTTLKLALEGTSLTGRVRIFRDDFEAVLRKQMQAPALVLKEGMLADSLVGLYFARTVTITADGVPTVFKVTASGLERDAMSKQDVAWYIVEAEVKQAPRKLAVLDRMLCEQFEDQQNIVNVLKMPQDDRKTLYFTSSDKAPQTLQW